MDSGGDLIIQGAVKVVKDLLWVSFVGFISWDPTVHGCVTFLAQDAE